MNRVIKFRAWDGKMMRTSFVVHNVHGLPMIEVAGHMRNQEHWKLMQFTGLLDKNGKEIYEGDILSADRNEPWVMQWNAYGRWESNTDAEININWTGWEVIGNIYENPELLGV